MPEEEGADTARWNKKKIREEKKKKKKKKKRSRICISPPLA
jgi:hypothetical protein